MARSVPMPAVAAWFVPALVLAVALLAPPPRAAAQTLADVAATPTAQCEAAVRAAERRYGLPAGLLAAISRAETGRPDPATGRLAPWPWSVQAENQGLFFATKEQAVRWVRDAQARGVASIDTGCLQVNLAYHPDAFETLDAAFDPRRNADYAARFLLQLHAMTGDWRQATGAYHSQTQAFADPYIARVQAILGGRPLAALKPQPPSVLDVLADAWRATAGAADKPDGLAVGRDWNTLLRPPARPPARSLVPSAARSTARPLARLAATELSR